MERVKRNTLNKTETATVESYLYRWNYSRAHDLDDVYKSCSNAKRRSFNYIWYDCKQNHGYGLRIVSHNCNFYSTVYFAVIYNNNTGELEPSIIIDTAYKRMIYNLTEYINSARYYGFSAAIAQNVIDTLFNNL